MANPTYDPYLGYGSQFGWGGRQWSGQDEAAFAKFLKKRGGNINRWKRNHPNAANVFDPVSQQVYTGYHPQIAAMQRMRQDMLDSYQRRMQNLGIFTNALQGMLGQIPGMISGPYQQGANTMTAGGKMYGAQLNADAGARAAAGNETLGAIGAPEGQKLQGGDAGGVLAGVAGWLPAQMMQQQGAAFTERAQHLPVEAQLVALQEAHDLMSQQSKDYKDWESQMQDLVSGIPGARAKVQSQYDAAALDARKQRLAEAKLKFDYWKEQARIYASQGRMDLAQQANARAEQARADAHASAEGLTPSGQPKPGKYVDPKTGRVLNVGTHIDPKTGKVVKDKTGKGAAGKTWQAAWPKFQDDIDQALKGVVSGPSNKKRVAGPYASEPTLFNYLMNNYGKVFLAQYPNSRAQVVAYLHAQARKLIAQYKPKPGSSSSGDLGSAIK